MPPEDFRPFLRRKPASTFNTIGHGRGVVEILVTNTIDTGMMEEFVRRARLLAPKAKMDWGHSCGYISLSAKGDIAQARQAVLTLRAVHDEMRIQTCAQWPVSDDPVRQKAHMDESNEGIWWRFAHGP